MLIERSGLSQQTLEGKIVLVTGAGGGIGYETVRSLLWLGAVVIVVEINNNLKKNILNLENEYGKNIIFIHADIRKESDIKKINKYIINKYKRIDGIINNATIVPIGSVDDVSIDVWDDSYKVNIRGPVLLCKYFLPKMKKQNSGVFITVSSSGAAPYLGAYEVFKTAQVELSNSLSMELEGTDIYAFTIGPGFVKTNTAITSIKMIAERYGKTEQEMHSLLAEHTISPEYAGVGFALGLVNAGKYHGTEIAAIQILSDYNIIPSSEEMEKKELTNQQCDALKQIVNKILETYNQQYQAWMKRMVFEKQWVLRDFKKQTSFSCDDMLNKIISCQKVLDQNIIDTNIFRNYGFDKLLIYYKHQIDLLKGFEKNPDKLLEYTKALNDYIDDLGHFYRLLQNYFLKENDK
jgi:NAD(P)-dependent dehydrogenase (short-subunit alcohol dehydrogenase family)